MALEDFEARAQLRDEDVQLIANTSYISSRRELAEGIGYRPVLQRGGFLRAPRFGVRNTRDSSQAINYTSNTLSLS